jgi:hypothetical protein
MSLKKNWDNMMEYSVALTAGLFLVLGAVGLLMVVGVAVMISKFLVFIR